MKKYQFSTAKFNVIFLTKKPKTLDNFMITTLEMSLVETPGYILSRTGGTAPFSGSGRFILILTVGRK